MGTTPNLGLPVYGSSDTPDWMDTNNGFEELDNIVGGAAGVQLDFANPLHVFTQSNNTYTATQTCWLFGSFIAADNNYAYVTIDGTRVSGTFDGTQGYPSAFVPPIRIESGSVIEVTNLGPDTYPGRQCLAVYPGEIVSDTFVWNEAIVELDYTNPLWVYDATSPSSYTATKRCYLIANLITTTSNTQSSVKVNGTKVIVANGNQNDGGSCYLPLEKGDIVTVENITNNLWGNIVVLDGTIKGSAPGNSGGGDVLELLDFDNAASLSTSNYVAPKAGAVIGTNLLSNSASNVVLTADGVQILSVPANTAAQRDNAIVYGIKKGTVLKLSAAVEPGQCKVLFVPYKYESIAPEVTVYNEAEVELDYANPLHTFTTGNLTYTATEDCYLVGTLYASSSNTLTINGVSYFRGYYANSVPTDCCIVNLKLKAGDIVAVEQQTPLMHVLKGTVVGSVGNIGGNAIPLLDFGNPIHTFTDGHLTYTVPNGSPDLYLCGTLLYNTSQDISLTINGTQIMRIAANSQTPSYPITAGAPLGMIRVTAGDVITVSYQQPNLSLFEER